MTNETTRPDGSGTGSSFRPLAALLAFAAVVALVIYAIGSQTFAKTPAESLEPVPELKSSPGLLREEPGTAAEAHDAGQRRFKAPELEGGTDWLNTSGPLRLNPDLRGKIVLLDFWTLCCINCMHILPDLAKLEKKYADQLVVIGVHTAKFTNEKNSESIRKAILRYEITHPVVNDANMKIWQSYGVNSWPTVVLIDPEGNYVGQQSGEGLYDLLDNVIGRLVAEHRQKKTLKEERLRFDLIKYKDRGNSPLFFPGKVLADGSANRLFIADSTHHRIVITDLEGKRIAVAGCGETGRTDGSFEKARFNDPQGMALVGDTLFVADCKNHLVRSLDLKNCSVKTVAGTGEQGLDRRHGGKALEVGLNSPWDLYSDGKTLFIAMAGHHQIWTLNLLTDRLAPFAGNGNENIVDGPPDTASFAQPSGLTSDGTWLYVADAEVSAIRAVSLDGKRDVRSIVGEGLFDFGDVDGIGGRVRLQHALGIVHHNGLLYVADTYNSKIKVVDPVQQSCVTYLGGTRQGWLTEGMFNEPGGLSIAGHKLYVADTNNHRIRVIDLNTKAVETLKLQGIEPPQSAQVADKPSFPNPARAFLPLTSISGKEAVKLRVELSPSPGFKLNHEVGMTYLIESLAGDKVAWSETKSLDPASAFRVSIPLEHLRGANGLRLSLVYFECGEKNALCRVKSQIWDMPLKQDATSTTHEIHLASSSLAKITGKLDD